MRHEIADGQDTVAWLREQSWFEGRLATYGASYLGFVQWALAMDPPPELVAAIVHIGPHDFSRSAYRNGVFDLYNYVSWSDLIAHQERTRALPALVRLATAERRLRPVLDRLPVEAGFRDLLGREPTSSERWLEHPQLGDPFWAPLQCGAALERITVPVLVVGGWHDLFIEQTLEQYRTLTARGVPTRLLVGLWTHLDLTNKGSAAVVESLAWLDRYAGPRKSGPRPASAGAARPDRSVRIGVGGEGRGSGASSPTGRRPAPRSSAGTSARTARSAPGAVLEGRPSASATTRPTLRRRRAARSWRLTGGSRDNRAVERRLDVLVFSSDPLDEPLEVIGEVAAELSVTRDNAYADLFVRLCDVDPRGRSWNICDGIVRLTDARSAHRHGAGEPDRRGAPVRPRAPDQAPGGRRSAPAVRPQPGQRAGRRARRRSRLHPVRHQRGRGTPPSVLLSPSADRSITAVRENDAEQLTCASCVWWSQSSDSWVSRGSLNGSPSVRVSR